jgi:hypothetical protein
MVMFSCTGFPNRGVLVSGQLAVEVLEGGSLYYLASFYLPVVPK